MSQNSKSNGAQQQSGSVVRVDIRILFVKLQRWLYFSVSWLWGRWRLWPMKTDIMPPLELALDSIAPLVDDPLPLWTREMITAMFKMYNCRFCEKLFYKCPHCPHILRSIGPHNCQTMWFEMILRTHFNRQFRGCIFLCAGCRQFDDCQHSLVYIGIE
jgi:hypothetical protein